MNIIRCNSLWLRYRAENEVKINHKDLFEKRRIIFKIFLFNTLCSKNSWIWVFIMVFIFIYTSSLINIDFLNVLFLDIKTVGTVVDQRTTNIAAIISISLVVVGFLINNLAVKSPTTYKLLFKSSLLYFTLYLTLSTIASFIIISTLRDTLDEFVFTRFVLAGTYLSIIILFLIGYLFRKIILFTNEKEIAKMLRNELKSEAKKRLQSVLLKKYSSTLFNQYYGELKEANFNVTLENLLSANIVFSEFEETNVKKRILVDINIWMLNLFIWFKLRATKDLYCKSLQLEELYEDKEIIWSNEKPNNRFEKWFLNRCILTKKIMLDENSDSDEQTYKKEFNEKIIQLAEDNKYKNLEITLEAYIDIYDLQMKNEK